MPTTTALWKSEQKIINETNEFEMMMFDEAKNEWNHSYGWCFAFATLQKPMNTTLKMLSQNCSHPEWEQIDCEKHQPTLFHSFSIQLLCLFEHLFRFVFDSCVLFVSHSSRCVCVCVFGTIHCSMLSDESILLYAIFFHFNVSEHNCE